MRRTPLALAALLLALASAAPAAVLVLTNGDRITGKITLRGKKTIRIQSPYGVLTVPRTKIERIVADDGTEEVLNAPPAPAAAPTPPPAPSALALEVRGDAFWYAWDPRTAPSSTDVALRVKLGDDVLASYVDDTVDPGEIDGAVVNAFAFTGGVTPQAGKDIEAEAPDTSGGRAVLRLRIPPGAASGTLRLAYLARPGAEDAEPFEIASTTVPVELAAGRVTTVRLRQDRGEMEFAKRRMRKAETFRLQAEAEPPAAP